MALYIRAAVVKRMIKERAGKRTAKGFIEQLDDRVHRHILNSIRNAKGFKTVKREDLL